MSQPGEPGWPALTALVVVAHDLKLSFIHSANVVHTITWINVNCPVDTLIGATRNHMTILKVATITMPIL